MRPNGMRWPLRDKEGGEIKGAGGGGEKKAEAGADGLGSMEDQARRMGWVPKDEFRGAAEKWTEADVFVKNGMESLPILRERNRALQKSNEELSKTAADFKKMSDTAFDRAYTKAKRDLEAEIEEKAKAGDGAGAKAAAKELAVLEGEKQERKAVADKDPVFDSWVAQNEWYSDQELAIEAEGQALMLRKRGEKSEGAAFLDKVKEAVKARFPEKFSNPRRNQGSGVERSAAGGEDAVSRGKKGWEQMPAEAKEAGERFVKQKFYKDRAAYAAAYWEQN